MNTPIAEAAWIATIIDRSFADLRTLVGIDNPLAAGTYCDTCGTRLDKPERPCPMCRPRARKPRQRSATALAILHESALLYAVSAA